MPGEQRRPKHAMWIFSFEAEGMCIHGDAHKNSQVPMLYVVSYDSDIVK